MSTVLLPRLAFLVAAGEAALHGTIERRTRRGTGEAVTKGPPCREMASGRDGARSASGSGVRCLEERGVPSHEVTDAGRRLAGDRLDIVREAIIPIGGMELGHDQHMRQDIVRQVVEVRLL